MTSLKPDDRKPEAPARDQDFVGAEVAMHRAAQRARRRAAETGGKIAIFENGGVVWVEPDDEVFS